MQGDGATFNLDKADPVGYGVYIPAPNMYTTMSISGSNQGEFVAMDWLGGTLKTETVDDPGNDISYSYPRYLENYIIDSTTINDYINPWNVEWLNVSAYGAENDTLSPYTFNTVFNYYVMAEESELTVPINNSMPMQIDLLLSSGPKILKLDWLLNIPGNNPLNNMMLLSPSGRWISTWPLEAKETGGAIIFRYIPFVAEESGTYKLLIDADYAAFPGYLNLEFLDFNLKNLAVNKVSFVGDGDDWPSVRDVEEDEWDAEWIKFSGNKGDKYSLDFGYDYKLSNPSTPFVIMFSPGGNALYSAMTPGIYDICFPETGNIYISFTDEDTDGPYLASLYLKEISAVEYNIGDNVTNIRVSREQRKAIDFTIEQDSFVRFNYTEWGEGDALVSSLGIDYNFIFKDPKWPGIIQPISPIETKSEGTMDFFYYYFPAGEYEAIILNDDSLYDSVLQISSEYVYYANTTIPITSLSYPLIDPTSSLTAQFQPDVFYSSLKQGQVFDINIAETGQYRFNWSIFASDNLAQIPTSANPSVVLTYNDTSGEYFDWTAYSHTPLSIFPAFETDNDFLYIAYPGKWHDMEFNITQLGIGGGVNGGTDEVEVWHGSSWEDLDTDWEDVGDFMIGNGSWVLDNYNDWISFAAWSKGVGSTFDIDGIDEDMYYWLRFECDNAYSTLPYFDLISLSNITMQGDVNFALVGDNGHVYGDFWLPPAPTSETDIIINQEANYDSDSYEEYLFGASDDPWIMGLEAGNYKLLVIPEQWSHPGSLGIRFSIEDYWGYHVDRSFTIPGEPLAHTWQIGNMVNVEDRILYNYSTYPYDFSVTYNDTLVNWDDDLYVNDEGYLAVNCYGTPYSWTQLVVGSVNITDYELYILQDLPWINPAGPFQEVMEIDHTIGDNNTIEFGVIRDNFTLLFEIYGDGSPNEMITLNIGLRQYNMTVLDSTEIVASYTTPVPGLDPLLLTLLIAIPAAIGVVVVIVYVVKKRGKT